MKIRLFDSVKIACLAGTLSGCLPDDKFADQDSGYVLIVCRNDRTGADEPLGMAPDANAIIVPPGGADGERGYARCHYQSAIQ